MKMKIEALVRYDAPTDSGTVVYLHSLQLSMMNCMLTFSTAIECALLCVVAAMNSVDHFLLCMQ